MDLPDLSHLPPWAAVLFVICLAVIFAATRTGWLDGLKKGPPVTAQAQVAAVIVDPSALNRLTASAEALNMTLLQLDATGKSIARSSAAEARNSALLAEDVEKLCDGIDKLREELIRAAAKIE